MSEDNLYHIKIRLGITTTVYMLGMSSEELGKQIDRCKRDNLPYVYIRRTEKLPPGWATQYDTYIKNTVTTPEPVVEADVDKIKLKQSKKNRRRRRKEQALQDNDDDSDDQN